MSTFLSGFTFIKNGLSLNYPFLEAILSIEPLCDEVVINVCFEDKALTQDDGTWNYLQDHLKEEKYKFVKSYWDTDMDKNGLILSHHTNIALDRCKGRYCFYIQGDEAIHEKDYIRIKESLEYMDKNHNIEGLVFPYYHFYGKVNIVKHTRNTYRREVRLIKNKKSICSVKDAQGFRHRNNSKLRCCQTYAHIYHYGWARNKDIMNAKIKAFSKLYHGKSHESEYFSYKRIWGLKKFEKSHPKVMSDWIESNKNDIDILSFPVELEWKNVGLAISDWVEQRTNYRIGEYKNFILD